MRSYGHCSAQSLGSRGTSLKVINYVDKPFFDTLVLGYSDGLGQRSVSEGKMIDAGIKEIFGSTITTCLLPKGNAVLSSNSPNPCRSQRRF